MPSRNKSQLQSNRNSGFTLIELLVVVAIIALLASIALIALMSARQKSRDAKRLADMTQMNTALELYFAYFKGYPDDGSSVSAPTGIPSALQPQYASKLPANPTPVDGNCGNLAYPNGMAATGYYYVPTGTSQVINGVTVYPDYNYYFCLGSDTGNFKSGVRILTPTGVR